MASSTREAWLDLTDRRLRARWFEPGPDTAPDPFAPTIVFLHEGLGCLELWRTFPASLCARTGLRGLAYDRTGYGESSVWPVPPGLQYLAIEAERILPEVLDAAGVEGMLLVGHGDGGTIALRMAATQPPLLRGVVTIGAYVVVEERTLTSLRHAKHAFEAATLAEQLVPYHGDRTDGVFHTWNDAWLTPGFRPMDPSSLPRVRVPVQALRGEHDEYGTMAQLQAISRGVSGRCETWQLPASGYAPHLQDETAVVDVVARFVSTLWRGRRADGGGAMRATLLAMACGLGAAMPAAAQPDPCQSREAQVVLADAGRLLARTDDEGAAARLREAAQQPGECHEIGLAALAVDGWVEARRLAHTGGAPDELGRSKDTLARLESVRAARSRTALLAQLAAYADAVLRAAIAAAQDERDEMQVYLAHARTLADSLALARAGSPWPLPLAVAEGELWLEVDRFADAHAALSTVAGGPFAGRVALGVARALERLGDTPGACAAYRRASMAELAPASTDRARAAWVRLTCREP